jgi:hypothetical protein
MAIYHLSMKTISRAKGQSATAASAYRAGDKIEDRTTGQVCDYEKKGGVLHAEIIGTDLPRAELWNRAEESENRKNSTVAREFEIALPAELDFEAQKKLALDFAREINQKHKIAVDVAIHAPGKGGDNRNTHAHLLCTTRRINERGELGEKSRELDDQKSGEIEFWRNRWETIQKERGIEVSAKTLAEQGIDREAEPHFGKEAIHFERRTGEKSEIRIRHEAKRVGERQEISKFTKPRASKFFQQKKVNEEILRTLKNVHPQEVLLMTDHHKTYKEGANEWANVSHKGQEYNIVIDEKTQRWNDRQRERQDGDPRRIGAVSLLMHLDKCKFQEAVSKLERYLEQQKQLKQQQKAQKDRENSTRNRGDIDR